MTLPADSILTHLGLDRQEPSFDFLNAIAGAWAASIPWESASRIARHGVPGTSADYARPPEAFFRDALVLGTGGTCFESNFALSSLLTELGYEAVLGFCDMPPGRINPHCAVQVALNGDRIFVDVGFPVPQAVRLEHEPRRIDTGVYVYHVIPEAADRWAFHREIGPGREDHVFTFKGEAVGRERFFARLVEDHEPDGLFLNNVIISRTFPDYQLRYDATRGLLQRRQGVEEILPMHRVVDLAAFLCIQFGLHENVIRAALRRTAPVDVPGW
jgi:arylamine N-acetyltransferase